jgi:serine/threonine-protein kinase RsbW
MDIVFRLCLPRDGASVPVVRHLCRDTLRDLGVSNDCLADVEVAVTEACTNVLQHATGATEQYEVAVSISGRKCEIRVEDSGAAFNHAGIGVEAAGVHAETGRGVHLMRALVDRLEYSSVPHDGTILHLVKTLEFADDSPLRRFVGGRASAS